MGRPADITVCDSDSTDDCVALAGGGGILKMEAAGDRFEDGRSLGAAVEGTICWACPKAPAGGPWV